MSNSKLSILYTHYLAGECTSSEIEELTYYFNSLLHEAELIELMENTWEDLSPDQILLMDEERSQNILERILFRQPHSRRNIYRGFAVAASILIVVCGAIFFRSIPENKEVSPVILKVVEINPASSKATLTLADGKQIILDSSATGRLASQSGASIVKDAAGRVVYVPEVDQKKSSVMMNTINVPRGGKFQIVLPDQSIVYLNSASSLSFPSTFDGNERLVNLTGEAYFEVTKNTKMPFKVTVNTNKQTVEVLGTHFNIKAYEDEGAITTTLAEGAVRVTAANKNVFLKPGQAAINNGVHLITQDVDVELALAWQKGFFIFNHENIVDIMKKLEKWYDIEAEFVGNVQNVKILGNYSRSKSLNNLLTTIAATKKVEFKVEGRRVIVIAK